jgi:hypothetical protein
MTLHHRRREDAVTAMGGADTGRSNVDEEANTPRSSQHRQRFGTAAPTSNCSGTPSRPPTPPSGTAVPTYHRSRSSYNAARHSHPQPKLHRETVRRPRPLHQHPGPPPRPKSRPPPLRRVDRADNLAALATRSCHPSHESRHPAP